MDNLARKRPMSESSFRESRPENEISQNDRNAGFYSSISRVCIASRCVSSMRRVRRSESVVRTTSHAPVNENHSVFGCRTVSLLARFQSSDTATSIRMLGSIVWKQYEDSRRTRPARPPRRRASEPRVPQPFGPSSHTAISAAMR